jgi:hypothetical protein
MTVGNSAIERAMSNGSGHSAGEAVVETNRLANVDTTLLELHLVG